MQLECVQSEIGKDSNGSGTNGASNTTRVTPWADNGRSSSASLSGMDDSRTHQWVKHFHQISLQLDSLRNEVLGNVRDQLQEFERRRASQLDKHSDSVNILFKEHLVTLQRVIVDSSVSGRPPSGNANGNAFNGTGAVDVNQHSSRGGSSLPSKPAKVEFLSEGWESLTAAEYDMLSPSSARGGDSLFVPNGTPPSKRTATGNPTASRELHHPPPPMFEDKNPQCPSAFCPVLPGSANIYDDELESINDKGSPNEGAKSPLRDHSQSVEDILDSGLDDGSGLDDDEPDFPPTLHQGRDYDTIAAVRGSAVSLESHGIRHGSAVSLKDHLKSKEEKTCLKDRAKSREDLPSVNFSASCRDITGDDQSVAMEDSRHSRNAKGSGTGIERVPTGILTDFTDMAVCPMNSSPPSLWRKTATRDWKSSGDTKEGEEPKPGVSGKSMQFLNEFVANVAVHNTTQSQTDTRGKNQRTTLTMMENQVWIMKVVRRAVHSKQFGALVLCAILANAAFIGHQQQYQVSREIDCYGSNDRLSKCNQNEMHFIVGELVFTLFFLFELVLRYLDLPLPASDGILHGRVYHFIFGPDKFWNYFDLLLVISSATDISFQISNVEDSSVKAMKKALVLLRVVRLLRVMRVIRALRFFRSLRLMLASISHSVTELFWVFVLLFFIIYMHAIFIEGMVEDHFRNAEHTSDYADAYDHKFLREHFGSVQATVASLYMSISGGKDWSEFYFPLLKINAPCGYVYLMFIFFVVFGVLNVVTGAFVDSMRLVSQRDNDLVIEQELAKEHEFKTEVKAIFEDADTDGSATLSWTEFESHLQNERVRAYFASLQLDISEARALFVLLDVEENDEVPIDKFINGCLRMRGDAKSIDVNMILYECENLIKRFTDFSGFVEEMFNRMEEEFSKVRRDVKSLHTDSAEKQKKNDYDRRVSRINVPGEMHSPPNQLLSEEQLQALQNKSREQPRRDSRDSEGVQHQHSVNRRLSSGGGANGVPKSRLGAALGAVLTMDDQ